MITFTLILFLNNPYTGLQRDQIENFVSAKECRQAGIEAVKTAGGWDKARFFCKEVADDRK